VLHSPEIAGVDCVETALLQRNAAGGLAEVGAEYRDRIEAGVLPAPAHEPARREKQEPARVLDWPPVAPAVTNPGQTGTSRGSMVTLWPSASSCRMRRLVMRSGCCRVD
jgi:hypothetical protein